MNNEFIKAQDGARTAALKSIATTLASIDTTLKGILAKLGEQEEDTTSSGDAAPADNTAPTEGTTPTTEDPTSGEPANTEEPTSGEPANTDDPQPEENQGEGGEN